MMMKKILIILFILVFAIMGIQNISYADDTSEPENPDIITGRAKDWIEIGENNPTFGTEAVTTRMQEIAGFLWGLGVFLAVAVGMILGIKFIISTPTGRAEVSKLITPYIIGVTLVVGALTIWRVVVTLLDV